MTGRKKNASETDEVKDLMRTAGILGLVSQDLDDDVHDTKDSEASDINNKGLPQQIKYLYECFGHDETERILRRILDDKKEDR